MKVVYDVEQNCEGVREWKWCKKKESKKQRPHPWVYVCSASLSLSFCMCAKLYSVYVYVREKNEHERLAWCALRKKKRKPPTLPYLLVLYCLVPLSLSLMSFLKFALTQSSRRLCTVTTYGCKRKIKNKAHSSQNSKHGPSGKEEKNIT